MSTSKEAKNGAKWEARREEILLVAAQVFAERGFQRSTTREIGDRVGILSGSLYYYVDSKESMIQDLMARYWDDLFAEYDRIASTDVAATAKFEDLVVTTVSMTIKYKDQVTILHQDWHSLTEIDAFLDQRMARVEKAWIDVLGLGVASGEFAATLEPALVFRTILGAVSWVPRWYRPNGPHTLEEIGRYQASVVLGGIVVAPPADK